MPPHVMGESSNLVDLIQITQNARKYQKETFPGRPGTQSKMQSLSTGLITWRNDDHRNRTAWNDDLVIGIAKVVPSRSKLRHDSVWDVIKPSGNYFGQKTAERVYLASLGAKDNDVRTPLKRPTSKRARLMALTAPGAPGSPPKRLPQTPSSAPPKRLQWDC